MIDGLDQAVLTMKKGEVALLTIPPEHAFGATESKQDLAIVPPNSTVSYEVELVSFEKVASPLWYLPVLVHQCILAGHFFLIGLNRMCLASHAGKRVVGLEHCRED